MSILLTLIVGMIHISKTMPFPGPSEMLNPGRSVDNTLHQHMKRLSAFLSSECPICKGNLQKPARPRTTKEGGRLCVSGFL
ncbi:hypothetical protein PCANC_09734 [Puccinia coronata f. sp. avenae]|uniref:Uncharacterized protein n=1 Tax=Puccinia coronata f. sp. avenae TaxID=200324 RepID=A0A2N5V7F4_9BASI|nr:hypothetical protein PCANC_09734 [Puccinia coronata f. sp. avenae]